MCLHVITLSNAWAHLHGHSVYPPPFTALCGIYVTITALHHCVSLCNTSHHSHSRGENIREARVCQMVAHKETTVGPAPCTSVGIVVHGIKGSRVKEQGNIFWIRAQNPSQCPVAALANYTVWRNDIQIPTMLGIMQRVSC